MDDAELKSLVTKMYYNDEANLSRIQKVLETGYGISMTKEEIYGHISGKGVKINPPTRKYSKEATPKVILGWLKKGISEEQIRKAAEEVGAEITEENWQKAMDLYEELNSKKEGEGR